MEKQRFKSCLNLCKAFIEPWSFQKIFGFEKLKTLWNNWLFRQLIHSVQLTWQGHKDLNCQRGLIPIAKVCILQHFSMDM